MRVCWRYVVTRTLTDANKVCWLRSCSLQQVCRWPPHDRDALHADGPAWCHRNMQHLLPRTQTLKNLTFKMYDAIRPSTIFLTCLLNTISVVLKYLLFSLVFILFAFAWEALCLTYHPDVGASLKLSINTVPSEVRVHLQPGRFGKFHTSLQTYCCHNVVCLNLKQQHNKNNHYI